MKKKLSIFFACLMMLGQSVQADPLLFAGHEPHIMVNNRILAKANGKVISVIDLMKKMDMLFYRQFPEYTSSVEARFQFYQTNWKFALQELVDKELIVADAEECKLIIKGGDVRKEMESLFGPNIVTNLDKVGLTFDEAWKMIHADLILRRMIFYRVHAKAMRQVTPQVVRQYYEKYAKEHVREKEWNYQTISIRGKNSKRVAETAQLAYHLLAEEGLPLEALPEKLKDPNVAVAKLPTVNISEEYHHSEKDLSDAFKEVLSNQESGSYSQPFSQKSRADNSNVYRILYLKSMSPGGVVGFNEVADKLRDQLMDGVVEKESFLYLDKLRKHFDIKENQFKEMVPEDFEPFVLK